MSISKMWTVFLDTTPRQWGHFGFGCFNDLRFAMVNAKQTALLLVVSVVVHSLAFLALALTKEPAQALAGQPDISAMFEVRMREKSESVDVEPIYDNTSGIKMKVPKQSRKKLTAMDELMAQLEKLKRQKIKSPVPQDVKRAWLEKKRSTLSASDPQAKDIDQFLKQQAKVDLKTNPDISKDELIQYFSGYQGQFQSCYEHALLKDESLNGRVHFEIRTGSSGEVASSRVDFEGVGKPSTKQELQTCLTKMINKVHLPQKLSASYQRTIQFQAVLTL